MRVPAALAAVSLVVVVAACGSSPVAVATSTAAASRSPSAPAAASGTPRSAAHVSKLEALELLWQQGGRTVNKPSTFSPAIHPTSGNVWVADPYDSVFWIFSPDGRFLESWGTPGKGPGQLDLTDTEQNPDGFGAIAFAPDGSFFVGDVGNNRIEAFDAQRAFVREWGTFGTDPGQFIQIVGVATDGKTVYEGDGGGAQNIQAFDLNGNFLYSAGQGGGFGVFMAIDANGNVFATNAGSGQPPAVAEFDATGKQVASMDLGFADVNGTGIDATGVAVDAAGNVFVSVDALDSAHTPLATYEFDPSGKLLRGWVNAGESLALSPAGDALYMAYADNGPNGWPYIRKYALPAAP